jgi:protein ImuB
MLWLALAFRDPAAPALPALACWAGRYSPTLHLDTAAAELLIEIQGCLRLFGGLNALCQQINDDLHDMGLAQSTARAMAPTPRAAQWLARGLTLSEPGPAIPVGCRALDTLPTQLAPLPLTVLQLDDAKTLALHAYGARTLGAVLALPRAGLARRLGTALVRELLQALGELPDPRPLYVFPERFAQALELPAKVEDAARLVFAAERLLAALAGWLHVRQAGVARCVLHLVHEDIAPSALTLGFASPTRERERLRRVLAERLARCVLPAAVVALRLEANEPLPLAGHTDGLFGNSDDVALDTVIERLRARLGPAAVHGLVVHADHRPEAATRPSVRAQPFPAAPGGSSGPRPLCLLPAPQPLGEVGGQPAWRGAVLRTPTFAERIESGWWDVGKDNDEGIGDIQRDYLVATAPQGERLWIFHDGTRWWLHGVFA